jgi:hypothetical protein
MLRIITTEKKYEEMTKTEKWYITNKFGTLFFYVVPEDQKGLSNEFFSENIILDFRSSHNSLEDEQVAVCLRPALAYHVINALRTLGVTVWVPRYSDRVLDVLENDRLLFEQEFIGLEKV